MNTCGMQRAPLPVRKPKQTGVALRHAANRNEIIAQTVSNKQNTGEKMKKNIYEFMRNMIPVLLGVLIALWIDNWNESRKDRIYIDNFYQSLKKEFRETDKEITEKIPEQKILLDTLEFYSKDKKLPLIEVIKKAGGINGPIIKLNYWKALSSSKIELLEYEKLTILADIEEQNEFLKYKRTKILDFVYLNLVESSEKEKVLLKIMMQDLIKAQLNVQNDIKKILNE
jgi:hypothetical protein